jgi:hypothetical protein
MGKGLTQLIYYNIYNPIATRGVTADMKCKIQIPGDQYSLVYCKDGGKPGSQESEIKSE